MKRIVMRLVPYAAQYHDSVLALHRGALAGFDLGMSEQADEADLRSIEVTYLRGGGVFLVGLVDEHVVAMGGYKLLSESLAELARMRIDREWQRQGFGTQLLRELERLAVRAGIREFCLETASRRPLTLEFYKKRGYRETGPGLYGAVETVRFRKMLDEAGFRNWNPWKKCAFPLLAAGIVAVVYVTTSTSMSRFLEPIATVDWQTFEPQMRDCIRKSGFTEVEERTASGNEVPLPWAVACRIARQSTPTPSDIHLGFGFPDSAEVFGVTADGSAKIRCFVRYFDGRASYIAIRANAPEEILAARLQSALERQFPGLPVRLERVMSN